MIGELSIFFLIFTRALGIMLALPIFSARFIPSTIKLALCALLAFLIIPSLKIPGVIINDYLDLILILLKELSTGLLLGFICRIIFFAVELAGHLISQTIGLNSASLITPFIDSRTDMPSMILYYLGGMLFLSLDLHHWVLLGFQKSFTLMPLGSLHLNEELILELIKQTSSIFSIAILISAPVIVVSFLVTVIFAILARAIPQMNVFFESLIVRPLVGLAVIGFTINLMAQHLLNFLRRLPEDFLRIIQLLSG